MSRRLLLGLSVAALAACQHHADEPVPAVLEDASDATLQSLKSALASALNKNAVRLADADLTRTSLITVVPPPPGPLETRSTAVPIEFRLIIKAGTCYAVRVDSGTEIELPGITCNAL